MVNFKFITRNATAKSRIAQENELASTTSESTNVEHKPESVKQDHIPNWSNFFGIDLKKSPNAEWYEQAAETNTKGEAIRNFKIYKGLGGYFTELGAKVIAKSATNFFLRAPYSDKNAFDIYFTIEKNFVHPGITQKEAADNFKGQFDSIYDSIHWDIEDCSIIMNRDFDTEEITLGVWTNLYNAEFLDAEQENKSKTTPSHCWKDFFGFNLIASPNSNWVETAGQVNPSGDKIRNFSCTNLRGTFFIKIEAKVIGNKATNFFFTAPYSQENAIDIYYTVEKAFAHPNITKKEAAMNLKGQFDSIYDSIHWDLDDCSLVMDRDYDTENIMLRVWTHLYNAEYLDAYTTHKEENACPVEDLGNNVKKIGIQLYGGVATLTFLKRVLVNRMSNTEESYGLVANGDLINVYNLETQENLYQFNNPLISRIIGSKLVAAMFQNINLDDIENPKVDIYIAFPGGQ